MRIALKLSLICLLAVVAVAVLAKDYELVKNSKPSSCIVLADNARPVEKHAASELSLFLGKVTGADVKIESVPSKNLHNIYLGTAEAKNMPRSAAIDRAVSQLKDDGFVLAADKDGVRVISKKPVGVLYGAYEILKKYAGLRWFAPGAAFEYCPKKSTVSVPEQVTVSNPSFKIRKLSFVCSNWNSKTIDSWDWQVRNGMTVTIGRNLYYQAGFLSEAQKRGAEVGRDGGHCFVNLLSDKLFDEHPEYFGLFDGKRMKQDLGDGRGARRQPCTSNPKVVEIMTESLKKILSTQPVGRGIYLIGNNDATDWCQCENCVKLDPPEEKQKKFVSTRYWTLVNKIAAEVLKTYPEADLWAWGYQNYQYPPTGIVPDPRVSIEVAIHGSCHRHSLGDPACLPNERFRDILTRYGKLKNTIFVLEYPDCIPRYLPIEKSFADDINYYRKTGLSGRLPYIIPPDGIFGKGVLTQWKNQAILKTEGYEKTYGPEMWPSFWQTFYINAQLLWNSDEKYDVIYEDMGSKYYGKAWPAMSQYRALLTKAFMETSGHICYGTPDFVIGKCLDKPGVEAQLFKLLDDAEKLAGNDSDALKRVKLDRHFLQSYWKPLHETYLSQRSKELNVNKRTDKIVIDGKLEESDWKKADFVSAFVATDGKTVAAPQSFVKMLYDEDNLYFAVEAMEPAPGKMKINAKERDGAVWSDSSLEFFITSPGMDAMIDTRGRYAHIAVNPNGVIYDSMAIGGGNADTSYKSQMEIKTNVLKDRWVAEIRIPAVALMINKIQDGEAWKINVARNRRLVDDSSQSSSWSNGVFHGAEAFRSVVLGGTALITNGGFEDSVAPNKYQKKTAWVFVGDKVPTQWSFHEGNPGTETLIEGGASSGKQSLRIKDGWIHQKINQPAEYRNDLLIRAKVRGKGSVNIAIYCYDRGTGRNIPGKNLKEVKVDSQKWTPVEASYKCVDDKVLRLAFQVRGEIDIDDVNINQKTNTDVASVK
jgi:hypothetical protein